MYADSSNEVLGREEAVRLDRADPTGRFRDRFHLPAAPGGHDGVYLCGHSLGLQPRSVAARVEHELPRWAQREIRAYFEEPTPWYPYHETVRPALARLVGATPEEVVAMNALTVNLHLMLATFYRPTATRRRILIEAGAFPSDRYAVRSHIELHRFDPDDTLVTVAPRDGERTLRTDHIELRIEQPMERVSHPGAMALNRPKMCIPLSCRMTPRLCCLSRSNCSSASRLPFEAAHGTPSIVER